MRSYKALLNSLNDDAALRRLTDEERKKLRAVFLDAFRDLDTCCKRNGLDLMLIGGTALGAVRHHGFIPWDDDLDVAMTRSDFEKLKLIFEQQLGDKYILAAPNYQNNAMQRFPMMLIRDTVLIEAESRPDHDRCNIKIDIFVIENIPDNKPLRLIKGLWCTFLMFITGYEQTYENDNEILKNMMSRSEEGRKAYHRRVRLGRLLSFKSFQEWVDILDRAMQYRKSTGSMGIPSGRGHYFGEIRPRSTFCPVSEGVFEGLQVSLPGNCKDYLQNLYGEGFMQIPPEEKWESHFIVDIRFQKEIV